jgi:hypothetical protein
MMFRMVCPETQSERGHRSKESLFILFAWWHDEHGQGKWEGKQEGKSEKRITESLLGGMMSTDRESGRGNKRARVTRGSRNPCLVASTAFSFKNFIL